MTFPFYGKLTYTTGFINIVEIGKISKDDVNFYVFSPKTRLEAYIFRKKNQNLQKNIFCRKGHQGITCLSARKKKRVVYRTPWGHGRFVMNWLIYAWTNSSRRLDAVGGWMVLLPPKKRGWMENLVYHFFRQLWLVLGVKLMEINSNLFSRWMVFCWKLVK